MPPLLILTFLKFINYYLEKPLSKVFFVFKYLIVFQLKKPVRYSEFKTIWTMNVINGILCSYDIFYTEEDLLNSVSNVQCQQFLGT